jgi:hypothetical protein
MYSGYNLNKLSTKSPSSYLTGDSPCAATAAFIGGDVVAWRGLANSDQGIYYTTIFSDSTAGLSESTIPGPRRRHFGRPRPGVLQTTW